MSDESQTQSCDRILSAFRERFDEEPAVWVRAPGRVALLGAHIDYSEGWVMPAAIEPAIWLAASPRHDRQWMIDAVDLDRQASFDLRQPPPPVPIEGRESGWLDYPAGVAWVLAEAGDSLSGMNVAYGGDLPSGAGVSSSAAVEVAFLLASRALGGDLDPDRHVLARLAQRLENQFLGVQSGIMDPFAGLFGRRDHLILLDCRTEQHELIPMPEGLAVLIVNSGVRRRLAGSGFNSRREQCEAAVELLQAVLPSADLKSLRDVDLEMFDLHAHRLPMDLRRRAKHGIEEMARVRKAGQDLRAGDVESFGRAMRSSHISSRDLYEVTVPELDLLCATAWATPQCLGAKLMGGGFGGCIAALVREEHLPQLEEALATAFLREIGREPEMFRTGLADGAEIFMAAKATAGGI